MSVLLYRRNHNTTNRNRTLHPRTLTLRYVKWSLAYELPDAYRFWDALEEALKAVAAEDVQVPCSHESTI